jgi:hypothetical protein
LIKHVAIGAVAVMLLTDTSGAALITSKSRASPPKQTKQPKPPQALAQSGTVRIKFVKAGLIVGVGSGSGTLDYRGKTFRLSISGVELGSVGITNVELAGTASNLHNVSDIAGTYNATGPSATIGAGSRAVTVQNDKGVLLTLRGLQTGLQASVGLSGITIALQPDSVAILR